MRPIDFESVAWCDHYSPLNVWFMNGMSYGCIFHFRVHPAFARRINRAEMGAVLSGYARPDVVGYERIDHWDHISVRKGR